LVLVVDDDEATRVLHRRALERAGIPCVLASDGREALEIVGREPVSLIVLDREMPGLGGLEVIARLRADPAAETLPVILVTGADDLRDRIDGLEGGADDYLVKPVAPDELVAHVRARLREHTVLLAAVESHRRRADATAELARATAYASTEAGANAFCNKLLEHAGATMAFLIAFAGPRHARVIGSSVRSQGPQATGNVLREFRASHLHTQTRKGPWVEEASQRRLQGGLNYPGSGIFAPILNAGGLVGLLAAVVTDVGATNRALATVADFADTASAVLGDRLAVAAVDAEARADLEAAIRSRAFTTHYQPVVDLDTGATVGFEALTRWDSGTRPDLVFAEAWRIGLGLDAELAAVTAAVDAARPLPAATWVSLNVSAAALTDERLGAIVGDADRPIVMEITEHERIDDYVAVSDALERLGPDVRLAVDDAGAGYASLHHVVALDPAFVKADIHFVSGIDADPGRQAMIAGLSHFARRRGSQLVAEGIETEAERATLRDLDIELGQGYLLGRPAPLAQFLAEDLEAAAGERRATVAVADTPSPPPT
jgi:EAL domain-containing protein (putative c-di-GMP-specific phosphodiesterase class I)/CheY-like chemotaxis protein